MNVNELKAQMARNEKTAEQLCAALGISTSAWYRKLAGTSQFTQSELTALRRELHLDDQQTLQIFFDDQVS